MHESLNLIVKENKAIKENDDIICLTELSYAHIPIPAILVDSKPGQFVMVKCGNLLLSRAFSIFSLNFSNMELNLLYKVVGRGTGWLSQRERGDLIEVTGPFGNGFSGYRRDDENKDKIHILVAGGIGLAPICRLYEAFHYSWDVKLLAGFKTSAIPQTLDEVIPEDAMITTEDESFSVRCFVTDLLEDIISSSNLQKNSSIFYAAGPAEMLKRVAEIAAKRNITCQVSLEARVACGMGACRGCAIKTSSGYQRVCTDGPVFNAEEVDWNEYCNYENKNSRG